MTIRRFLADKQQIDTLSALELPPAATRIVCQTAFFHQNSKSRFEQKKSDHLGS